MLSRAESVLVLGVLQLDVEEIADEAERAEEELLARWRWKNPMLDYCFLALSLGTISSLFSKRGYDCGTSFTLAK